MRKNKRCPASPEAMRAAIQVGDALVRAGYVSMEEMAEALDRVKRGYFDAADIFIANAVKLRRAGKEAR